MDEAFEGGGGVAGLGVSQAETIEDLRVTDSVESWLEGSSLAFWALILAGGGLGIGILGLGMGGEEEDPVEEGWEGTGAD